MKNSLPPVLKRLEPAFDPKQAIIEAAESLKNFTEEHKKAYNEASFIALFEMQMYDTMLILFGIDKNFRPTDSLSWYLQLRDEQSKMKEQVENAEKRVESITETAWKLITHQNKIREFVEDMFYRYDRCAVVEQHALVHELKIIIEALNTYDSEKSIKEQGLK